jgi:hypothetical protein
MTRLQADYTREPANLRAALRRLISDRLVEPAGRSHGILESFGVVPNFR